jgi:hypothetical protein
MKLLLEMVAADQLDHGTGPAGASGESQLRVGEQLGRL